DSAAVRARERFAAARVDDFRLFLVFHRRSRKGLARQQRKRVLQWAERNFPRLALGTHAAGDGGTRPAVNQRGADAKALQNLCTPVERVTFAEPAEVELCMRMAKGDRARHRIEVDGIPRQPLRRKFSAGAAADN